MPGTNPGSAVCKASSFQLCYVSGTSSFLKSTLKKKNQEIGSFSFSVDGKGSQSESRATKREDTPPHTPEAFPLPSSRAHCTPGPFASSERGRNDQEKLEPKEQTAPRAQTGSRRSRTVSILPSRAFYVWHKQFFGLL